MGISERVVIVPAYNEERTIAKVVAQIQPYAKVIVVNDCSKDKTAELARAAGADVVTHEKNKGYEGSLNSGFQRASEKGFLYALTFDADGQHEASIINSFFEPLENNKCDLVCGVRPHYARFAEFVIGQYFQIFYKVRDPLCGMKSYKLESYRRVGFFDSQKLVGSELLLRCLKFGDRVIQVSVPIHEREDKPRFGSTWRANMKILKALLRAISI